MSRQFMRFARTLTIATIFLCGVLSIEAQRSEPAGEWRSFAGTTYSLKYSPVDQITKENVRSLLKNAV
jgi:glucose dehydrogenase